VRRSILVFLLILNMVLPTISSAEDILAPVGERIVKEAALWIGTEYGTSDGSDGYGSQVDCSGLVMQVYAKFGIELPRTSDLQAMEGDKIELDEMIAGDIVCFIYEDGSIGHVGIYIGANAMIHSPRPGKAVEISRYFEDWGSIKSVYGRRISVESDYTPENLPEDINTEIESLLASENTVSTEHLKDIVVTPENPIDKTIILEINNPIMKVNDEEKFIENDGVAAPCIINDRAHLPLRSVAEEFGANVEWIGGQDREIKLHYNNTEITLWIDSLKTVVNGEIKYIDSVPVIMNDKTYLPIRFIANEFNWNLDWDGENQKISLSVNKSEI